jgi:hypothetical protein
MGICAISHRVSNNLTNKFIKYNIIDKEYNIIIGIYSNNNQTVKSNTMINQGICIGYNNNNEINKIRFGMIHRKIKIVELYFENNIKLFLIQEKNNGINKIKIILTLDNFVITKYIDTDIIKELKLINNNSDYIDLIHDLV